LKKYLANGCEDSSNIFFAILDWWEANNSKYPILFIVARDVPTISTSIIASELGFNMGLMYYVLLEVH